MSVRVNITDMEFPTANEYEQAPEQRQFNDYAVEFKDSYERTNNDSQMFVEYLHRKFADTSVSYAMDDILRIMSTPEDPTITVTEGRPDVPAIKVGATLGLEAVTAMFVTGGWQEGVARACRQVIHGRRTLISSDTDVLSAIAEQSQRIQVREAMLKRAATGRNLYTSNYAPVVMTIANDVCTSDASKQGLINGFGFIADAAMRHQADQKTFAGQARRTLKDQYFFDAYVHEITHHLNDKDK